MIRRKECGLPGTKVMQSPKESPNRNRSINSSLENTLDQVEIAINDKAHGLPALKQA